jgi:hypothetical protein
MEPISAITTALSLTKSAADLSKKLYDFGKGLKDRDQKRQVEEMTDALTEFKRSASELEDENRELREKLRFRSDDYEFRNPFWYHKERENEALCPKCFASNIAAPMGEQGFGCTKENRACLVCGRSVQVSKWHGPSPPLRSDYPSSFSR